MRDRARELAAVCLEAGLAPDDPVTILYTSGTTGRPKGVVLTHRNIWFEAVTSARTAHLDGPGITVSYLPFAHIAERLLGMYIPQLQGARGHPRRGTSDPLLRRSAGVGEDSRRGGGEARGRAGRGETGGRPHSGIELRIAEDGEILLRGPITTPGHHRDPAATAELLDADGG